MSCPGPTGTKFALTSLCMELRPQGAGSKKEKRSWLLIRHLLSIFRQEFLLHFRNTASTSIFFSVVVVPFFLVVLGLCWAQAFWLQTAAAALHCSARASHCEHRLYAHEAQEFGTQA